MCKIRTLIVDDSVVVRRIVSEVLGSDPEIEVAGVTVNGRIALAKLPDLVPDVVVLDVEMPEMDGLETLRVLRRDHLHLPVIMFSSLTERGAETTLDALSLGASDYAAKPAAKESPTAQRRRPRPRAAHQHRSHRHLDRGAERPARTYAGLPGRLSGAGRHRAARAAGRHQVAGAAPQPAIGPRRLRRRRGGCAPPGQGLGRSHRWASPIVCCRFAA